MAIVGLLVSVLLLSLATGCGPRLDALRVSRTCYVWRSGPMSSVAVEVVGERASIRGRRRAYFETPSRIVYLGDIGRLHASYRPPRVSLHGRTGDINATIGAGNATVHGMMGNLTLDFNAACTDRQIALGVASLMVIMSN